MANRFYLPLDPVELCANGGRVRQGQTEDQTATLGSRDVRSGEFERCRIGRPNSTKCDHTDQNGAIGIPGSSLSEVGSVVNGDQQPQNFAIILFGSSLDCDASTFR
jgi:hypothetical protein